MNRDIFDEKLAQRMQSQQMQPDDAIWSRIESTLDATPMVITSKQRNIIPLVSTLSAVAAILLLSFLLLNNETPSEVIKTEIQPIVAHSEEVIKIDSVKDVRIVAQYVAPKRKERSSVQPVVIEEKKEEEEEAEIEPVEEAKPTTVRSVRSSSAVNSNQPAPTGHSYNERFKSKKKGNSGYAINVSGAANFSSTTSIVRNNSNVVSPVLSIDNKHSVSLYSTKQGKREWKHNIPISFSVSVQKMFTRKIGIETGITYTYLSSESKAEGKLDQDLKQRLNYIGIPISVVYSIADGKRFGVYGKIGFMVDKALSATAKSYFNDKSKSYDLSTEGVQCSSTLQVGGQYHINRYMSLYLEPTVSYYLDSKQPVSYRTENDFGFSAIIGLRFNL